MNPTIGRGSRGGGGRQEGVREGGQEGKRGRKKAQERRRGGELERHKQQVDLVLVQRLHSKSRKGPEEEP